MAEKTVAKAKRRTHLKAAILSVFHQTDGITQLRDEYLYEIADRIVERIEARKEKADG